MRQINDRLDATLKSHIFDLIEEQGEDHRNQHIQKKLAHGDDNRIGKNLRDVFELKHILKISSPMNSERKIPLPGLKS